MPAAAVDGAAIIVVIVAVRVAVVGRGGELLAALVAPVLTYVVLKKKITVIERRREECFDRRFLFLPLLSFFFQRHPWLSISDGLVQLYQRRGYRLRLPTGQCFF